MAMCETGCEMTIIGFRVVRGPDWMWKKQDGGEGNVGTVRHIHHHDEIFVLWDNGLIASYRGKSFSDLLVLDNAPAGVVHEGTVCAECNDSPIYGMRWQCSLCPNYDLCSLCYHNGKHNRRHKFWRISMNSAKKQLMSPRLSCKPKAFKGLYKGAKVTRSTDWQWDDQDGGIGAKGTIMNIQSWCTSSVRSAAYVLWESTGVRNLYRIGYKGMVDLRCVDSVNGGLYYKHHLPVLGDFYEAPTAEIPYLVVDLSVPKASCIEEENDSVKHARLNNLTRTSSTCVNRQTSFSRLKRKTVDLMSLKKNKFGSSKRSNVLISDIYPGDIVEIKPNMGKFKKFQNNFGEWMDSMNSIAGNKGTVLQIHANGDIDVEVGDKQFTLSATNVSKVQNKIIKENLQSRMTNLLRSSKSRSLIEHLVILSANGASGGVKALLEEHHLDVNRFAFGYTPLHAASQNGHIGVISVLLNHNADLEKEDSDGDRAIHHAAFGNAPAVAELISSLGGDLNARNNKKQTPLHVAVNKEHKQFIEMLIKLGVHVNLQDCEGDTALHDAISKKRTDIANVLLESGADIALTNSNGFNCFHLAALQGNTSAVKLLLKKIKNRNYLLDLPKQDGFTALHLSCFNNHMKICKLLLEAGASVNVRTEKLETPLHLAAERLAIHIVKMLLRFGADVNCRNKDGNTPLHEVIKHHPRSQTKQSTDHEIAQKLLSYLHGTGVSSALNVASLLTAYGATLDIENTKNQTIWDMASDPQLKKFLQKKSASMRKLPYNGSRLNLKRIHSTFNIKAKCVVCSEKPRNVVFLPCVHAISCESCAPTVNRCPVCRSAVRSVVQIGQCCCCKKRNAMTLFRPCFHMKTCEICSDSVLNDRCHLCDSEIEGKIVLSSSLGYSEADTGDNRTNNSGVSDPDNISRLQQQLQYIKEKTMCPICLDNLKNMVFFCGHGTCQLCGDKIKHCPICRKPIDKSILLYN